MTSERDVEGEDVFVTVRAVLATERRGVRATRLRRYNVLSFVVVFASRFVAFRCLFLLLITTLTSSNSIRVKPTLNSDKIPNGIRPLTLLHQRRLEGKAERVAQGA